MSLLDRHIIVRYLANFCLLFGILFVFAISIDVVVQFDRFTEAARRVSEADGRSFVVVLIQAILDFHAPRIFQFFAFMTGLVGIAAAGFTIVQMHRSRELVAIMAAGIPLHRVAVVILSAQFGLVILQLADQEFMLPRVASRLVREHRSILAPGIRTFEIPLMRDAAGDLMYASSFDPQTGELDSLLVLRRDDSGTAVARLAADSATWNESDRSWILQDGRETGIINGEDRITDNGIVESWATDLSPRMLLARHSLNFAQMLSISQLRDLQAQGGAAGARIERTIFGRFSGALVNLLVPAIVIPFFLLRSPAEGMLIQSLRAAAVGIPMLLGGLIAMTVAIPGLPPGVGAFVPVAILLPVATARIAYLRS